jgi:hypothetical protein
MALGTENYWSVKGVSGGGPGGVWVYLGGCAFSRNFYDLTQEVFIVGTIASEFVAKKRSFKSGLPDFSLYNIPKRGKIYIHT